MSFSPIVIMFGLSLGLPTAPLTGGPQVEITDLYFSGVTGASLGTAGPGLSFVMGFSGGKAGVWYSTNLATETEPDLSGLGISPGNYVNVGVLTSDSAIQVANKTVAAMVATNEWTDTSGAGTLTRRVSSTPAGARSDWEANDAGVGSVIIQNGRD